MNTLDYSLQRGEVWERLVVIKDRRTRRVRTPVQVAASIDINGTAYYLPSAVTAEGAVLLALSPQETKWLTDGTYTWDMVATISRSQAFTSTPLSEEVVLTGTITVSSYANITPMEVDDLAPVALTPVA